MVRGAKSRAKQRGLPFNLKPSDIVVPKKCPVLGIPLRISKGALTDHSPSLDKIVPRKGYVRGNVIVVSMRVNRIKSDATIKELRLMADFYEQYAKTTSGRR